MEDAEDIDIKAACVFRLGDVNRRLVLIARAGVVDEDIEFPELLEHARHGRVPISPLRDVHLLHDNGAGVLGGELLGGTGVDVADEDLGAFLHEEFRDGCAEA